MSRGRFRPFGKARHGREVEDGTGQALRDAHPLELAADDDMARCIALLDEVEGTLKSKTGRPA